MQEEFHAKRDSNNVLIASKQKYGWDTLIVNIWLPSMSELVGVTGTQASSGVYLSAMQGLSTSSGKYWTDAQGGAQFTYFKQYNASGGGEIIWDTCNRQQSWLRSPGCGYPDDAWRVDGAFVTNGAPKVTGSGAVHPAVSSEQIPYRSEWFSFISNYS